MFTILLAQTLGSTEPVSEIATMEATAAISTSLLFMIILSVVNLVLWIWSIADILKRSFEGKNDKMIWFLVILIPIIGAIIYLIVGRKKGTTLVIPVKQENLVPPTNPTPPSSTPTVA